MNMLDRSQDTSSGFSVQQAVWEQVSHWSDVCQRFLDWQRSEILEAPEPSVQAIEQHRLCLKWLLRFGRAIYLTAADPDYPDKRLSSELRGRLAQLEHSWRIVHECMSQAEAEQVLGAVFP